MFAKKTHTALMLAASAALLGGCATYGMDDDAMDSASAQETVFTQSVVMGSGRSEDMEGRTRYAAEAVSAARAWIAAAS